MTDQTYELNEVAAHVYRLTQVNRFRRHGAALEQVAKMTIAMLAARTCIRYRAEATA